MFADLCHLHQGVLAWCKLNESDNNLVVAFYNVKLPNKDNCIVLKNNLIICKDNLHAWQTISFKHCYNKLSMLKKWWCW